MLQHIRAQYTQKKRYVPNAKAVYGRGLAGPNVYGWAKLLPWQQTAAMALYNAHCSLLAVNGGNTYCRTLIVLYGRPVFIANAYAGHKYGAMLFAPPQKGTKAGSIYLPLCPVTLNQPPCKVTINRFMAYAIKLARKR